MSGSRFRRLAVVLATLAMMSTACFGGADDDGDAAATQAEDVGPPQPGGVFRASTTSDAPTIDPHKESTYNTHTAVGLTYSKLVDYVSGPDHPYGDTEIEGDLAETWEASEDGTTWTFNLRQGVQFQDVPPVNGREFTSADVMCTLDRIRNLPGQQSYLIDMVESWEAPDDYTVVFNLDQPFGQFDMNLAGHFMWILPCEGTQGQFDLETQAIGTGPYMLDWTRDKERRYTKHENYYDEGKPYLDEISVTQVKDSGARNSAFRTQSLDVVGGVSDTSELDLLISQVEDVQQVDVPSFSPQMLYMNQAEEPFDDYRVRRAVALAIDKENMLDKLRPLGGQFSGPVVPTLDGGMSPDEAEELIPYDPDQAKELLAEAGFPDGFETEMMLTDGYGPDVVAEAQWVQQDLAEVGIDITLDVQEYATYFAESWAGKQYTMGFGPQTPFLQADSYLSGMYHSEGTRNWFNINDPELDQMIEEQRGILDQEEWESYVLDLQRYLVENVSNPVLNYIENEVSLLQPYVHGYYPTADYGGRYWANVWLGPEAPGRE